MRPDGTPKGRGYLGELPMQDGRVMTEQSIGVDGMLIPSIVPNMPQAHIDWMASGQYNPHPSQALPIDNAIVNHALQHALQRKAAGQSPFAD